MPNGRLPGTVIAGRYVNPVSVGAGNIKVYLTVSHQQAGNDLAQTANKEFEFFTENFGAPETSPSVNTATSRSQSPTIQTRRKAR